jgi:hypothetical protein
LKLAKPALSLENLGQRFGFTSGGNMLSPMGTAERLRVDIQILRNLIDVALDAGITDNGGLASAAALLRESKEQLSQLERNPSTSDGTGRTA